jgi:hypothetical protein
MEKLLIGMAKVIGRRYTKLAIERIIVLSVSIVIHQIITNCVMDEPNKENNCPE